MNHIKPKTAVRFERDKYIIHDHRYYHTRDVIGSVEKIDGLWYFVYLCGKVSKGFKTAREIVIDLLNCHVEVAYAKA